MPQGLTGRGPALGWPPAFSPAPIHPPSGKARSPMFAVGPRLRRWAFRAPGCREPPEGADCLGEAVHVRSQDVTVLLPGFNTLYVLIANTPTSTSNNVSDQIEVIEA